MATTIKGTVRIAGVATGGVPVRLYRADTGDLLGSAVSASSDSSGGVSWTKVANEGGSFPVGPGDVVRYGADTRWFEKTFTDSGTFGCNTDVFGGDPASGTAKTCQIKGTSPPSFVGDWQVAVESFLGDAYAVAVNPDISENNLVKRIVIG